jgi:hypothetical protein
MTGLAKPASTAKLGMCTILWYSMNCIVNRPFKVFEGNS